MSAPKYDGDDEAPQSSSLNRRTRERFAVTWNVDCETEDTFLYATITNISEMGIFVWTEDPHPVGTTVRLKFSPADVAIGPFDLEGSVQWINPVRPGCPNPGMGIRFEALAPEDRERLVEVIHTIAYLPPS